MVQEYHIGDEPIPGYRLTKFLGRGGFGEVWQAVAPGRTEVALKIISLDRKQGMKEFRSLRLVKRIRHPNLTPILAFWLKDSSGNVLDDDSIDMLDSGLGEASARSASMLFNAARADQLVIAMGLGDMNLLALLQDYQAAGQTGIPSEELLDYMEGCARAIDFLNTARHDLGAGPVAIQHCDIKPQNIMIVGDAVQLCDFGLARSLTDVRSTSVAGSIAYGAPELFWENKPSGATDQYSLAISYYELRTGCLPFGLEMAQLEVMQAHRDGTLDFSRVDDGERAVLVRATAPSPDARFERTIDMVRALRRAVQSASQVAAAEAPPAGSSSLTGSAILESGREILPGYKLLEHLFHADAATDVWSATATGAKPQALWIYDLSRAEGRPDLASLRMAQRFANPRLARIAEFWLVDETGGPQLLGPQLDQAALASCRRLIAVTELTRSNLAHRLEECRESMGTGIPQPELLAYLRMAAEGVDALNAAWHPLDASRKASLLHRELRPENLLLFHHDVKIGNLAWVRALESDAMQLPESARRPARTFSAPELDRDRLTRWSDQYSLAVCYAVMRTGDATGHAPSGMAQAGTVQGGTVQPGRQALDLAALPPAEAEVLARALNVRPEQRFADCRQMVAALERASRAAPLAAPAASVEAKPAAPWSGTIMAPAAESDAAASSAEVQLLEAPEGASLADTNPETEARRSTIVEPFPASAPGPAAPSVWRRRLARVLAAAALAGAMAAAFLVGDDAQPAARQLAGDGQYKQAIESLDDASWLRSWRVDRGELRRTIVGEAVAAAQTEAEAGEIAKACSIFAELAAMPEVLLKADIDEFRQKILPLAIQHARDELTRGKYRQAGEVQRQLAGVFAENVEVVGLGQSIVARASAAALEHARLDDFEPAADIYLQLKAFALDAAAVKKLRTELIEMGVGAVDDRVNRDDIAGGLAIYRSLKKAFDGDHGVDGAGSKLIDKALGAIRGCLEAGQIVEAKAIYRELSQLLPDDSDVEKLGDQLLAAELADAEKLLADGKWAGALAIYERTASSWTPENPRLEALSKKIIRSAIEEINKTSAGMGPEQAIEAAKTLSAAFPEDPQIKALADKIEKARGSSDAPERVAVELLDRIDSDLDLGIPEDVARSLDRAQQELKDLPGREKLRQRLALARAHLAVLKKNWDEANELLAKLGDDPFPGNEGEQRTRFGILKALARAKFDGGALDASTNLLEVGQAAAAVMQGDAAWNKGKRFRSDANRFGKLIERLVARCVESAFSDDRAVRQSAGDVLVTLQPALANAPDAIQAQAGAVRTHLLLVGEPTPERDAVAASLVLWRDRAGEIGPQLAEALASDLARWGTERRDPQSLQAAIDALGGLRRYAEAPKARYAELLVEQLAREAASPEPAWPELLEKCQFADEASANADGAARQSFVKACWAECLWEGPSERDPVAAAARLKEALSLAIAAADQPYLDYVAALIGDSAAKTTSRDGLRRTAAKLYAAFEATDPAPILRAEFRQQRAAELLFAAAAELTTPGGDSPKPWEPPAVSPEDAGDAYRWLQLARMLASGKETAESKLAWAVAANLKVDPDRAEAAQAIEDLISANRREPWILIRGARAAALDDPPQAIRRYALAFEQIDSESAAGISLAAQHSSELYNDLVQPAIQLVEQNAAASDELKPAIAELYSAKGRLVRVDASLAPDGVSQEQAVFAAADKAVEYNPTKPAYYVQRGFARWRLAHGRPDLEVFQQEDVDPALNRGEPPAAAFGLRGHAQLAASREKTGAAAVELINKATDDYDKAIQESSGGPYYTELLDGGAAAYVERANLDRDSSIEQLREYLTRAVKYAKESTDVGYRPYPESAWLNLGNAEEDFTAVIGEKSDHYCEAIEAFGKAGKAAFDAGRSPASAHYSQGRCRCKLVEDLIDGFLGPEQACGKSIDVHLQTALDELQKALQVGTDDPRRALEGDKRAEANYWRAKLYVRQADRAADGQKSLDLANDAILAASEGVKETSADWPIYQDWSAKIALKMGQPERARQCAEKLLGVPTAPLNKKALAVRHLVDSYTRQKNPKAGLEALKKYLNATEFRTAGRSRVDLLTLCSRHITEFADDLWNATNQKLGEDTAREAIKLALEIPDPVGASKAYVALADHVSVTAYRSTSGDFTLAQLHLYADCLAKAIDQQSIGQQSVLPASLRSRKELARAHRRLARWPNLPLDKRIGYAAAGIKTLIGAEKATRDPREVSEIVALRKDLEMLSKASK